MPALSPQADHAGNTMRSAANVFVRAARERDKPGAWPWSEKASQIPTRLNRMTEEHE